MLPDNPYIDQYTANGTNTDFAFNFEVVQGRSVSVYVTLSGNTPDEEADRQDPSLYIVNFNSPNDPTSAGVVTFNTAPLEDSTVTITPDDETDVTVTFSNTEPLNQENLNKGYAQQSSSIDIILQNYLSSSIRYNINENQGNLDYENLVEPLADQAFWRRIDTKIISQDYDAFVQEVEDDIVLGLNDKVNASANNANFAAEIAANSPGNEFSGSVETIDQDGNIVVGPTISGFSALAGSFWARQWSESVTLFTDDYGNTGFGARYYSDLASIAASAAGGIIDELRILDTVNTTTTIDLIQYDTMGNPTEPWENVLPNSFSVYLDGSRLQDPVAYSPSGTPPNSGVTYTVNAVVNPTLANPSTITFSSPIPANTEIYVARSEAQGDGAGMRRDGTNATFVGGTLLAARDLSNVPFLFRQNDGQTKIQPVNTNIDTLFDLGVWMTDTVGWSGIPAAINNDGIVYVETPVVSDGNSGGGTIRQTYVSSLQGLIIYRLSSDGVTWSEWMLQENTQAGSLIMTSTTNEPLGYSFLNGQTITDGWDRLEKLVGSGSVFITQSGSDMVLSDIQDFLRPIGSSGRILGSLQGDAARNAKGTFSGIYGSGSDGTGPFSSTRNAAVNPASSGGNPPSFGNYTFNLSKASNYPTADEFRPRNYSINLAIYHGVIL